MPYNYALMEPTNVGDPNYYHRVVDCQWACPAHFGSRSAQRRIR
jgi:hypothetical protein